MLKPFCDNCGEPAKASSLRLDSLSKTKDLRLGLEILLLGNGSVSNEHHICDECLAEFLVVAINYLPSTTAMKKHAETTGKIVSDLRKKIVEQQHFIAEREQEYERKEREYTKAAQNPDEMMTLKLQVQTLQNNMENRIKQEVNARYQAKLDEINLPDYTTRIRDREAKRISK